MFLDQRVFHPVLSSEFRLSRDPQMLREVKVSVQNTRNRYSEKYPTAAAVKAAFLSDLQSIPGQILAEKLRWLNLPRFEDVQEDFLKFCGQLGV